MTQQTNTESEVQRSIVETLRGQAVWVIRIGVNRARRGVAKSGEPGMPDLLVLGKGWHAFAEVKRPGGKLNDEQLAWHARARDNGHTVVVWTSAADALRSVRLWRLGAERKARVA